MHYLVLSQSSFLRFCDMGFEGDLVVACCRDDDLDEPPCFSGKGPDLSWINFPNSSWEL
jgi:hypothetical protein